MLKLVCQFLRFLLASALINQASFCLCFRRNPILLKNILFLSNIRLEILAIMKPPWFDYFGFF